MDIITGGKTIETLVSNFLLSLSLKKWRLEQKSIVAKQVIDAGNVWTICQTNLQLAVVHSKV